MNQKERATDKQISYMQKLGIEFPPNITKWRAANLISATLDKIQKLESSMDRELQRAIDKD